MTRILNFFDSTSVSGRIDLEALANDDGATVYLIRTDYSDTRTDVTDNSGRFRFDSVNNAEYFIQVDKDIYLRHKTYPFTISSSSDTFFAITLIVGDVVRDNKINIFDASRVKYQDPEADFNLDGNIDDNDLYYIKNNIGLVGD